MPYLKTIAEALIAQSDIDWWGAWFYNAQLSAESTTLDINDAEVTYQMGSEL